MSSKNIFLILAVLSALFILALAFSNAAVIPVAMLSAHADLPLAMVIIVSYLIGAGTIFCVWRMQRKEIKIEQKKLEWKTEDAKLQTEIQSDKVHQLELQVKTLESALEKALKRSKS